MFRSILPFHLLFYNYVIFFILKYRAVSQAAGKTFSVEEDGNNAQ